MFEVFMIDDFARGFSLHPRHGAPVAPTELHELDGSFLLLVSNAVRS
ncbi:hypothetical protein ACIP1T_11410 [Pseudomonas japonica]